jgi:hypothetical protein
MTTLMLVFAFIFCLITAIASAARGRVATAAVLHGVSIAIAVACIWT